MKTGYVILGAVVVLIAGIAWCYQSGNCGGDGSAPSAPPSANPLLNAVDAGTGAGIGASISSAGTSLWNLITTGSAGDQ